jgi:hypothetical protein
MAQKKRQKLTWRIECTEQVHKRCDSGDTSSYIFNKIAHSRHYTAVSKTLCEADISGPTQQSPEHIREGKNEQSAPTKCIDCPDSRPGEQEVDETKAETSPKGSIVVDAALLKNGATVKSNDVD